MVRSTNAQASTESGHATSVRPSGTAAAVANTFHCRRTNGISSRGARIGLTANVNPIATPAHRSRRLSNSVRKATSPSRTRPLMLVKTRVFVTVSELNAANRRIGASTESRP